MNEIMNEMTNRFIFWMKNDPYVNGIMYAGLEGMSWAMAHLPQSIMASVAMITMASLVKKRKRTREEDSFELLVPLGRKRRRIADETILYIDRDPVPLKLQDKVEKSNSFVSPSVSSISTSEEDDIHDSDDSDEEQCSSSESQASISSQDEKHALSNHHGDDPIQKHRTGPRSSKHIATINTQSTWGNESSDSSSLESESSNSESEDDNDDDASSISGDGESLLSVAESEYSQESRDSEDDDHTTHTSPSYKALAEQWFTDVKQQQQLNSTKFDKPNVSNYSQSHKHQTGTKKSMELLLDYERLCDGLLKNRGQMV